jgi:hypothetical protein
MSDFYAPNSVKATMERWRVDGRVRAMGAICYRGGTISGKELAAILGVSPRALRHLLVKDGHFLVEYRANPGEKDEAWYKIRPASCEPPKELPPLRREALPDGGKAPRIRYSGGPTPAIERFAAVPRITQGEKP